MGPEGSLPHSQEPAICLYVHAHVTLLKIYSNIILPSAPRASKWSISISFTHQNPVYTSSLSIRATCPADLILLNLITRTLFGEQYRSLSSLLCNFLYSPVTSSFLGQIFSSPPYSQTPSGCVPPST